MESYIAIVGLGTFIKPWSRDGCFLGLMQQIACYTSPIFPGSWRDYLTQYRSHEPESLPIILEMVQRIASHPELPDLIEQELEEAPCPVFDIPYPEIVRYSSYVEKELVSTWFVPVLPFRVIHGIAASDSER